jgi:glycosyltransferase involved in cell wall biosynthesis
MLKSFDIPIISVIVPIYKTEKYVSSCLESLINQTLQNIEIICVNDGSPDNSLIICEKYAQNDPRIIIISQTNQGLSAARNTGLSYARGEYIQFCDSDDYFMPTMCEKMYTVISSMDVDMAMSGIDLVYEDMPPWSDENWFSVPFRGISTINDDLFKTINVYAWNKIFKREFIVKYNIKFPYGLHYEDAAFLFKYLMISRSIYCIDLPLYNYVRRSNSIMSATMNEKSDYAIDHIYVINDIAHFMELNGLFARFERVFIWMILSYIRLCCLYGGETIFKKAFTAGVKLMRQIDLNTVLFKDHGTDDVIRLYALKTNDYNLYASVKRQNEKFEDSVKKNQNLTFKFNKVAIESDGLIGMRTPTPNKSSCGYSLPQKVLACLFFPWYIYKMFCSICQNILPVRCMHNLVKAYIFCPYYTLKIYLHLLIRRENEAVE